MPSLDAKSVGATGVAAVMIGLAGWQVASFTGAGSEVISAEAASEAEAGPPEASGEPADDAGLASNATATQPAPSDAADAAERGRELARSIGWTPADDAESGDPLAADTSRTFDFEAPSDLVAVGEALTYAADGEPGLAGVGRVGKTAMIDAWRSFVTPLVDGRRELFVGAASRLGSLAGDESAAAAGRLFDRLEGPLSGAEFDLSAAITRPVDPASAGAVPQRPTLPPGITLPAGREMPLVPMMMLANQSTDDSGTVTRRQTLEIPLQGLFPDAQRLIDSGARLVEVWTPARMDGRRVSTADLGLSVFLAHDASGNRWVPSGLRLNLVSDTAQGVIRDALRSAQSEAARARAGSQP